MLKKEVRINKGKEYKYIFKNGRKISGKYIIAFFKENNLSYNKFGIITSKKIGNAVTRNKAKRKIRAIIKNGMDNFKGGNDIVIVARMSIKEADYISIERDFNRILKKAGL